MIRIEENYTGKRIVINLGLLKLKLRINNLLFKFPIKVIDNITPKTKHKIIFLSEPDFSDNAKAYYEYLEKEHKNEFELIWIYKKTLDKTTLEILDKNFPCAKYYWSSLKGIYSLITAKYHVITHANVKYSNIINLKKHTVINLWHGMPIKTLGFNEKGIVPKLLRAYKNLGQNSYFFVTSDIFKLSMIACFLIPDNKIYITGQPRTDYINSNKNINKIEEFLNINNFKKIILYTPTYKEAARRISGNKDINKEFNNIFYMDDYNEKEFIEYLESNEILFIIKPHPFDEKFYQEVFNQNPINSKNIKIIYNRDLLDRNLYFYEFFQYSDLLITDFSSIAIDYAIINKPIIYLDNLTEEYKENRGLILNENYKMLIKNGPQIKTFIELKNYIKDSLSRDSYINERLHTIQLLHKYPDNLSCKRIYEIMKKLK